jgi:lipopolysaccharide biosynthesis glycosyltransferase
MAETLTIASAVDDTYALPLAVMLRSIAEHLPHGVTANAVVLSSGLAGESLRLISDACHRLQIQVTPVVVSATGLSDLKISHHISITTYYRLLLEAVLPDVDRVIYLDADTIVLAPITELWGVDLGDSLLGAVGHASKLSATFGAPRGIPSFAKLGLPGGLPTFNAGVMVIDLDGWRKAEVSRRTLAYLRAFREDVLWWDQDGLNVVLHGHWKPLPAHWNVMTSHFAGFTKWQDSVLSADDYERAIRSPSIIHFSSEDKPWFASYAGLFANEFRQYAAQLQGFTPCRAADTETPA